MRDLNIQELKSMAGALNEWQQKIVDSPIDPTTGAPYSCYYNSRNFWWCEMYYSLPS